MADVIIVGGGVAGLYCARLLHDRGLLPLLLESSDDIGGRVRTDSVDGFLLDRGFQVLLTSYPEAQRAFDYASLQLGRFQPGALIRYNGRFHRFADPWRSPRHALTTLFSPLATLGDKLRVARLRHRVCRGSLEQLADQPEMTTRQSLVAAGFSSAIIERFFQPFLGGVFLEQDLQTSSRLFDFVMRMFSTGVATLPRDGMQALPRQLASGLPNGSIETNATVDEIEDHHVRLADGRRLSAPAIVLATPAPVTARLIGDDLVPPGQSVSCYYFAADRPPVEEPILMLNGEARGPIQNACVPSQVQSSYAPQGKSLVSASVVGAVEDHAGGEQAVRDQLIDWFGPSVKNWQFISACHIPFALPAQVPPALSPVAKPAQRQQWLFICGDHMDTASLQGALVSARRAALAVETCASL
jgi:phytoene dehydrogenase-like protein